MIEVKTSLRSPAAVEECAVNLATIGKLCRENGEAVPWLGIFSYEGTLPQDEPLLDAVEAAYDQTGAVIDCLHTARTASFVFGSRANSNGEMHLIRRKSRSGEITT